MLCNATRPARRGGWLAIALLAALLVSPAVPAGASAQVQPKVPLRGDKPLPADCALECFDSYTDNVARCHSVFCTHLLFIELFCDANGLAQCENTAGELLMQCLEACQESGG